MKNKKIDKVVNGTLPPKMLIDKQMGGGSKV